MLLKAHCARAEDARYGAGQLARGSQRAPTCEDCDDGWQRVEEIVLGCEFSAREARRASDNLKDSRASELARRAEASACAARQLIIERNHAYTFHVDPRFSFGEGWYLAAASLLAQVPIQLEPGRPETPQAELFLSEAGLGSNLVPYRSRPRANKALPDLVARAFRVHPGPAQAWLRKAFLGEDVIPEPIRDWVDRRLVGRGPQKKVLLWVRDGTHQPSRNTDYPELARLCRLLSDEELTPVLVGDALRGGDVPVQAVDMTLFWKESLFRSGNLRRAQLQLFEFMKQERELVGQLGVTTAGMDGPALMGLPTMYLTREPNVRLGRWVGAIPGYEEIVRGAGYLDRIAHTLREWRDAGSRL